mmetsp:Transcript_345/g.624  ORF Transcript_345/g.624 Transcript_345/m.624 type:complete len:112 (-) Transcript_345:1093-1428(-)
MVGFLALFELTKRGPGQALPGLRLAWTSRTLVSQAILAGLHSSPVLTSDNGMVAASDVRSACPSPQVCSGLPHCDNLGEPHRPWRPVLGTEQGFVGRELEVTFHLNTYAGT